MSGRTRGRARPPAPASDPAGPAGPRRTCVGCRRRTIKAELLRVVVAEGACVPDPRGVLPGRGAHLHPDEACLDLAERRKAFPRALRVTGPLDLGPLRAHLAGVRPAEAGTRAPAGVQPAGTAQGRRSPAVQVSSTSRVGK